MKCIHPRSSVYVLVLWATPLTTANHQVPETEIQSYAQSSGIGAPHHEGDTRAEQLGYGLYFQLFSDDHSMPCDSNYGECDTFRGSLQMKSSCVTPVVSIEPNLTEAGYHRWEVTFPIPEDMPGLDPSCRLIAPGGSVGVLFGTWVPCVRLFLSDPESKEPVIATEIRTRGSDCMDLFLQNHSLAINHSLPGILYNFESMFLGKPVKTDWVLTMESVGWLDSNFELFSVLLNLEFECPLKDESSRMTRSHPRNEDIVFVIQDSCGNVPSGSLPHSLIPLRLLSLLWITTMAVIQ
mmetsp:Transcript_15947/g.46155  ORF Transcript_15947/g.46155 Transcript_15947/m.46155 type:complete len:294 (+) Transcript_15947:198-1079(+)|eukprot:CAMPEP_0176089528 /NCGR_PEP_ID=MMETSP0120_2-20121206/44838_1 /TAXON_ID=160619 /ORGANISM="Kryptoperidinium foliaceum, Strain CCMP 1326" /LENGTH=293 /DNA_ID=CAMNT_0017423409 /DNA_START=97 /DNA_END=978 /DNA_ORIENTATION=-